MRFISQLALARDFVALSILKLLKSYYDCKMVMFFLTEKLNHKIRFLFQTGGLAANVKAILINWVPKHECHILTTGRH